MRLLDLFCGAGGAAMGYHQAGFDEIVGVDIKPQPRYPFHFVQADALEFGASFGAGFDAIHASPPCQALTQMSERWRGHGGIADSHVNLIAPTRDVLIRSGRLWIIENVVGAHAHMRTDALLHGGMFSLGVNRPRRFESSFLLMSSPHPRIADSVGVYGERADGRRLWRKTDGTILRAAKSIDEASVAMGIDWMEWNEIRESIPPAYTEFIGRQLIEALKS